MKRSMLLSPRRPGRLTVWLAIGVLAGLAAVGAAVAGGTAGTTTAVSAAFSATTLGNHSSTTCTGADGTYTFTDATFTGTSTSTDPNLNGNATIHVRSVLNTTTNLGWLNADVQIVGSTAGNGARGDLTAVNSGGHIQGLLFGNEGGSWKHSGHGTPSARLLANVSATFDATAGFSGGSLGTGTTTNTGIATTGGCKGAGFGDEGEQGSGSHGDGDSH
jgi:hypothetical protein